VRCSERDREELCGVRAQLSAALLQPRTAPLTDAQVREGGER
jgi:hypothetical protein